MEGTEKSGNQAWRASYVDATCHKLVAIPISFLIPGGYVTRSPGQGAQAGYLWGTPADLDRGTAEAGSFDFTRIIQGVFWARAAMNVGYIDGQFVSGPNKTESAERKELERSGAKIIRYERVKGAPRPALEIVAEYQGKRVYMLYLAMGIDSNALLTNYHPPAAEPAQNSDRRWQEFLAGISAAPATATSAPQATAAATEPATGAFWEAARISDAFSAYRQKFPGQTEVLELDLYNDKMRLLVQDPKVPENVDSYTYRDGAILGPKPEHWDDDMRQRPLDWNNVAMLAEKAIPSCVEKALERLHLEGAVPSFVQIMWHESDRRPTLRVYVDGARKDGWVEFDLSGKLISSETH